MPRKRMIDPSFWRDEKIAKCSYLERLLFEGLWTFAEDSGVGRASPLLIKADVFPYDTLREADIQKSLVRLASLGLILLYERDGQQYYFVMNFKKHQTINKPSQCYLPTPLPEDYGSPPVVVTSEDKRKEDKLKEVEINTGDLSAFFESVWALYPRKKGKGSVSDTQKRKLHAIGFDELKRAIQRFQDDMKAQKTELKFMPYGSTFFNSGYVDYLDKNYEPSHDGEKPQGKNSGSFTEALRKAGEI